MPSELLPFFSKYWHYVILGIASYCLVNFLWNRKKKSECENENENDEDIFDKTADEDDLPALPKDLEHISFVYDRPSEEEMKKRSREFYAISNARRTIRFFSPDPVPIGVIHDIIGAAGTAPSGAHTEPWTFVVVSNDKMKAKIREIVEREEQQNYLKRMGKKWTRDLTPLKTNWVKDYLTVAPYLIFVFKQTYGILPDGRKKNHYYHEMSVAIACGVLLTAIQYAGLVTLTSTPLNCGPALRCLLGRPPLEKLCLLLPVGYPAIDATVPNLHRKPLADILVEFT
ncbi:iodotyrosine dehalogenase 1 [Fopius arisanus]|uniref:Iodotyrosine dehalogenase 1 n=1 Tax=Fopius arisanus TaxID=64838 RepID=A0A9R1SWG0_9HYME|nr:PREDICTED: iodotyrosine dehalogenase 1 [Fopius arisanus]